MRAIIKQRKRTARCKDCGKTVIDMTWNELEARGWSIAVPMYAWSTEIAALGGKEGYYAKYPEHKRKTADRCKDCRQQYLESPEYQAIFDRMWDNANLNPLDAPPLSPYLT